MATYYKYIISKNRLGKIKIKHLFTIGKLLLRTISHLLREKHNCGQIDERKSTIFHIYV